MPWSSFFLEAFLSASKAPFEYECTSKLEAKRRQRQFHTFRRGFRQEGDPATIKKLNLIIVRVVETRVQLISQRKLRELMVEELEREIKARRSK